MEGGEFQVVSDQAMLELEIERENVSFWLKVKPRSARERLSVDSSGRLCLEVPAPPVEDQANQACVLFLARALRLPQACVVILAGRKSRRKLVRITGRSAQETVQNLRKLTGDKD